MTEDRGWAGDFAELRRHLDHARDGSHQLAYWVRAQLGPADLPASMVTLVDDISKAQSLVDQLSDRLCFGPLGLFTHGHPMSREAYYLLVALGVLHGGSYTGDSYADFQMLHYEDDERRSYICLDELPPAGTLRRHSGMRPEEISWERLRPEQRDFCERHLPEIAVRFKREQEGIVMPSDNDVAFYGKFLEHATGAALDTIAASLTEVDGASMDDELRDELQTILLDAYRQLHNQRSIGSLDQDATKRMLAVMGVRRRFDPEQLATAHGEVRKAVLQAFADFGRSMTDFVDDAIRERGR